MRKNMKNILKMFFLLGVIALVQITPAAAWSVNNHHDIANKVYYNLPADVQEKLDLDAMRDGADDPDIKFFDFQNHQYPASYQKAKYWLEMQEKHKVNIAFINETGYHLEGYEDGYVTANNKGNEKYATMPLNFVEESYCRAPFSFTGLLVLRIGELRTNQLKAIIRR